MKEREKPKREYMRWSDFCANFDVHPDAFETLNHGYGMPVLDDADEGGEILIPWDDEFFDWCAENADLANIIGIPGIYWYRIGDDEKLQGEKWHQGTFDF